MIIVTESPAEAELLSRRLPAIRHLLGTSVQIQTPTLLTGGQDPILDLDRTIRTAMLQQSVG